VATTAILAAAFLGLLPPATGEEAPTTVVRMVSLDESRLFPAGVERLALAPGSVGVAATAWSPPLRTCSPMPFTMTGLVWDQSGEATIPTSLSWSGVHDGHARAVADPDEGPDPGSPDDSGLAGTPPVWTDTARCLRIRLRLPAGEAISNARAVFVDTSGASSRPSFLDRAGDILSRAWGMATAPARSSTAEATTAQPAIITRAQWAADESLRRCGPDYAPALKMAHVHHTVNSNAYPASKADDLIRGIYAYHVEGRKYCDIAYNFLIDRFGRIYEGRYGGIDQPVIGGHAMGFNTGSTGIAALGTFTTQQPPKKVISAYKRLLAWRLDVAHLRPTGTTVMTSGGGSSTKFDKGEEVTLSIISGHRDTGLTECPGAKLYAKLPTIRTKAEARGLPKIWDPLATPNPAPSGTTQIQLGAKVSQVMSWTIEIANATTPTTVFKRFSGSGTDVLVTWDRTGDDPLAAPAPPGTYLVTFRAAAGSLVAREAVVTLTLS
jgi:N-acetylmuramoyl-L-alanine amidase